MNDDWKMEIDKLSLDKADAEFQKAKSSKYQGEKFSYLTAHREKLIRDREDNHHADVVSVGSEANSIAKQAAQKAKWSLYLSIGALLITGVQSYVALSEHLATSDALTLDLRASSIPLERIKLVTCDKDGFVSVWVRWTLTAYNRSSQPVTIRSSWLMNISAEGIPAMGSEISASEGEIGQPFPATIPPKDFKVFKLSGPIIASKKASKAYAAEGGCDDKTPFARADPNTDAKKNNWVASYIGGSKAMLEVTTSGGAKFTAQAPWL